MTLLDRFRTQPRHTHPDPLVRLAFVDELPLDDRDTIAAMAAEDEDPRVRRAAVKKLMDPVMLGRLAGSDRDEDVRAQASAMLLDIALEMFEGLGERDSLEAVDAVTDARTLAQIARGAQKEMAALRAVARLKDGRLLGAVARHAVLDRARHTALQALHDLDDRHEIAAVALNGEFKDTAVAAVELLTDRDTLEQIATRSRNKSAAKRARALLRERQAAEASPSALDEALWSGDLHSTEEPEGGAEGPPAAAAVEHEPPSLADTPAHAELAEQSALAPDPAEAERRRVEVLDMERRRSRLVELLQDAESAVAVDDLSEARRRFTLVRHEWRDLTSGIEIESAPGDRLAEIEARLMARESEAREADARARQEALVRLMNVVMRVEPLATSPTLTLKAADRALRDVRTALGSIPPLPTRHDADEVTGRLKAVQGLLAPKVQELREADEWKRFANVSVQEQLCVKMEALRTLEDPAAIAHEVRDLQQRWRDAADVPRAKAELLWQRFKTAHDEVWPRCEAYFAEQARVRSENFSRKLALCERAEALAESTSWIQTADKIKQLQTEWKSIGAISGGREKAVWERFRNACDRFFTRRHEDLVRRKAAWAENLTRKEALAARAEALAESTDWDRSSAEIKRLQAEWKTIGPVKRSKSEAVWLRFRAACDRFFVRYAQRHEVERAERVAAREALCLELERMARTASPHEAAAAPPAIPESRDEVESAEPSPPAGARAEEPGDLLARVRAIRYRWQQETSARPVDHDSAQALDERFAAAFARVLTDWPQAFAGSDLDAESNQKRMETLVERVERLAASLAGPAEDGPDGSSPSTRLAAMLKEALAANTIAGRAEREARLRAAAEDVRQAQASWSRIGLVPQEARRLLTERFQRACRRVFDRTGDLTRLGPSRGAPGGPTRTQPRGGPPAGRPGRA
jgi:CBS domain-containing protein